MKEVKNEQIIKDTSWKFIYIAVGKKVWNGI